MSVDTTAVSGRFVAEAYRVSELPVTTSQWETLTPQQRLPLLRAAAPCSVHATENTACIEGHERIVQSLDGAQPAPPPARFIRVGRGTAEPTEGDRALSDPVGQVDIIESDDNNTNVVLTTVLSESDGNVDTGAGETLNEVAVIAGGIEGEDEFVLNRSLFAEGIDKNETITVTISAQLIFDAVMAP